jgi:hypothetical protein
MVVVFTFGVLSGITRYIWCREVVTELTHATIEYLHSHPTKIEQIIEMLKTYLGMLTRMDANMESMQERMDANQAELKSAIARMKWEEPTSADMGPEVAQRQVPRENAAVMLVGEPRNKRRTEICQRSSARRNRNGPRGRMGAERIWSQSTEGRPIVRKWHNAGQLYL